MASPMERSIVDAVAARASERPEGTAILCGDETISYGRLEELTARCRGALRGLGIESGDRVAFAMSDGPEFVIGFLGTLGVGAIAVPCSTMLRAADLAYLLNDSGARLAIVTADQSDVFLEAWKDAPGCERVILAGAEHPRMVRFEEALAGATPVAVAAIQPETPAFVLYTSGSTGSPKGAVHCHSHIPHTVATYGRHVLAITPADRLFSSSRLFFAYGLGNSLSFPLSLGATSVLCRERPRPPIIADILACSRPTVFFGVPAVYRALLDHQQRGYPLQTDSPRLCVSAGERLPASIHHDWKARTGLDILDGIGSTELLHIFISNRRGAVRPGSSGVPVEGYEITLTDDQGRTIEAAGRGHLHVRGASALSCYWNLPHKTAETIRDGWVRTGDVYRRDEAGFYWFEGRSDDMFKSSGMWVSPTQVETVLATHPAVIESAVIGDTDAGGTSSVSAFVVLRDQGADRTVIDEIRAHAARELPGYMVPKRVCAIDELPRTPTGKVQRFKLREARSADLRR
jgi:benzoate-CoA ligase family protein